MPRLRICRGDFLGRLRSCRGSPEGIIDPRHVIPSPDAGVDIELDIRLNPQQRRYVCHEVRAASSTGGAVTTEALRHLQIAEWIVLALLMDSDGAGHP